MGMLSLMMLSTRLSPIAFMNLGPPVTAPSLEVVTISRIPLLLPSSTVGYHFSMILSPKPKASFSNSSLRTVTTSSLYPVSISRRVSSSLRPFFVVRLSTPASSMTCCAPGLASFMMSSSLATAAPDSVPRDRVTAAAIAAAFCPSFCSIGTPACALHVTESCLLRLTEGARRWHRDPAAKLEHLGACAICWCNCVAIMAAPARIQRAPACVYVCLTRPEAGVERLKAALSE
mmetsp:Transcript_13417/g.40575  ORF Transcript_13417/g.40575 Transcript_13417/m.40575 type:complete len:232 (+) Transcript_13417:2442-3137(+)